MLREKKTQIIGQLADDLSRSNIVIATSYQGLPAKEMTGLRRALAGAAADYHVVKNTLIRLAAQRAGKEQIAASFMVLQLWFLAMMMQSKQLKSLANTLNLQT